MSGGGWQQRLADRLRERASESSPREPVHEQVAEGVLIAVSGIRLALTNHIIERALRDRLAFDDRWLSTVLDDEVTALVEEKQADAARIERAQARAAKLSGQADHASDYRRQDLGMLQQREDVNRGMVEQLKELRHDEDFVSAVARAARDAAVSEMVQARLISGPSAPTVDGPERERRMNLLRLDIHELLTAPAPRRRHRRDRPS